MADEYQKKYRIPSLTTDAIVLRKHKSDNGYDILLVTRGKDPFKGKLAFPGGFVNYGEDPKVGCVRELKEELGLDVKEEDLEFKLVEPIKTHITFFFKVKKYKKRI